MNEVIFDKPDFKVAISEESEKAACLAFSGDPTSTDFMLAITDVEDAIEAIKAGEIIIVVDDEDRENEGDLILAAEKVTPDAINFLSKYGRGLVCAPLTSGRLEELQLDAMVHHNTALHGTKFTVSVDAVEGTTTGISAFDRALTIRKLIDKDTKPSDLGRPGHIFPLQAMDGGVLARAGHTEATVDLARLAGLYPAGVLCEVMDDDGNMARVPRLMQMAKEFDLKIITVKDLIEYRRHSEKLVERVLETKLPTRWGAFDLILYKSEIDDHHHNFEIREGFGQKHKLAEKRKAPCRA